MLLDALKRQDPFHLPLLIVYTFAANFSLFFSEISYPAWEYSFVFSFFEIDKIPLSDYAVVTVSLAMNFIQALMINHLIVKYQLIEHRNLLGAFIYISVTALFPGIILPAPASLAIFFVLGVLYNMLGLIDIEHAVQKLFFSAFYITLGGILYTPVFLFLILLLISSFLLKSPKISEIIIIPMGLFIPVFLLTFGFYFFDRLDDLRFYYLSLLPSIDLFLPLNNYFHIISMSFLLIIMSVGYFNYLFVFSNKTVRLSRYHQLFFVYFFLLIVIFLATSVNKFSFGSFFLVPVCLFLTTTFDFQIKKSGSYLFTSLIILVLIMQLVQVFY